MKTIGTATILSTRAVNHGLPTVARKPRKDRSEMTEKQFAKLVIDYAQLMGWRVAHFRPARVMRGGKETYETPVAADGKGFPDLVLIRGRVLLFWELKVKPNRASSAQVEWIVALHGAGQWAKVLYPEDWDLIQETLARP